MDAKGSSAGKEIRMPTSLIIKMTGDKEKQHGPYLASLLQGVLMERIDPAYAGFLHESRIHPYSQYVESRDDTVLWHVNVLTKEAEEAMIAPLLEASFQEVCLRNKDESLKIKERSLKTCTYESMIEGYYLGECSRHLQFRICTPMAFKQNGRYCIIPSTRLIFQSLMKRFDACQEESTIFTEELLREFESLTEICDYRLRSVRFSLEGVRIPSFIGDLKVHVNGPQQMANVAWMLAKFGEYSGIGIKTGMGMGAVRIEDRLNNKIQRDDPVGNGITKM